MSGHRLYTPEILAAAVSLASFPLTGDLPYRAEARSRSCGSRIELGLLFDADGRVERVGLASRACAIGQASAAVFAMAARGMSSSEIVAAQRDIARWIEGVAPAPAWPGLELVAPAREYPARHGAMMLPWNAAVAALAER